MKFLWGYVPNSSLIHGNTATHCLHLGTNYCLHGVAECWSDEYVLRGFEWTTAPMKLSKHVHRLNHLPANPWPHDKQLCWNNHHAGTTTSTTTDTQQRPQWGRWATASRHANECSFCCQDDQSQTSSELWGLRSSTSMSNRVRTTSWRSKNATQKREANDKLHEAMP